MYSKTARHQPTRAASPLERKEEKEKNNHEK
jgi:hypothetical protein